MKVVNPTAKKGEDIASEYLLRNGYKIIERNFRKRYGEIDVVALDPSAGSGQEVLVFVEVKTRTSDQFGNPLEAITPWKLRSLVRSAQYYKLINPKLPEQLRIDAVAVTLVGDKLFHIELVKNITGF